MKDKRGRKEIAPIKFACFFIYTFNQAEIEQCFPIMSQLRLHLKVDDFVQQVQAQMVADYQLAYIYDSEVVRSNRI